MNVGAYVGVQATGVRREERRDVKQKRPRRAFVGAKGDRLLDDNVGGAFPHGFKVRLEAADA